MNTPIETEAQIAAYMAKHRCSRLMAVMALNPAKKQAIMAGHDAGAKRMFDDIMVDGGWSV